MSRIRTTIFLFAAVLPLMAASASAAVITFDNSGASSGTISYAGGLASAVGSGIGFDIVQVSGAPQNNGNFFCQSCVLSFTTGANTGGYTWASGGSFNVVGSIWTGPGGTGTQIATGNLLSGAFASAMALTGGGALELIGAGLDTKNAALLAYLGLTGTFQFASSQFADYCPPGANGSFNCNVTVSDLSNTGGTAVAAEPASLLLLGVGLLGIGHQVRRRLLARRP